MSQSPANQTDTDLAAAFLDSVTTKKEKKKIITVPVDDDAKKIVKERAIEKGLSLKDAASDLIRIAHQRLKSVAEEKDRAAVEAHVRKAG